MTSRSRVRRRARLLLSAVAIVAIAAVGQGCEGSNLFEGEVSEQGPEITSLIVPSSVETGEEFDVQVTATAPRGIQFIEVRVSGAATDSIRENYDGEQVAFLSFPLTASSALGSQVTVRAFVQDETGRSSSLRSANITVNPVSTGTAEGN